jgi:NAD-reducing hydrogenase small subunit
VTGNVTALRNALGGAGPVLARAFGELADPGGEPPSCPGVLPPLLDRVLPLHHVVTVDAFLPGCPPAPADLLRAVEIALGGAGPAGAARAG